MIIRTIDREGHIIDEKVENGSKGLEEIAKILYFEYIRGQAV